VPDDVEDAGQPIRVIVKAVDILDKLSSLDRGGGITELSRLTGMSKSTIHNLLSSLVRLNVANVDPITKRYSIGPRALHWASSFIGSADVAYVAGPYLERLRDLTGETAHLHITNGLHRICIMQVLSKHGLRRNLPVGEPRPLWSAATGRVLMTALSSEALDAYLSSIDAAPMTDRTIFRPEDIRQRVNAARKSGYEIAIEETELGVAGVSLAIRNHDGETVAAVTVSGPLSRWNNARILELLPAMLSSARQISSRLGWDGNAAIDGASN
jgi:DNA-binding IclR family transcriptional regulator